MSLHSDGMLPQTLGLSASLGADSKSLDIKEATEKATTKLHKMCQNLDAAVVVFPEPTDSESLDQTNPDHGEDIVLYVPRYERILSGLAVVGNIANKAGYPTEDAPSTRCTAFFKMLTDIRTDGHTLL